MYIVTNRIDVPSERAQAFEERFIGNMRNNLPKVTGLARATLDRPVDAGTPYKVTMEFVAESDFEAWKTSDAFRASHARPAATETPAAADSSAPVDTRSVTGIERHVRVETYTAPNA
ncbi:antibiotic biosynthesis monooxygenase [Arthrobacter sp. MYb227]|uniref:antibiotic biosynthesis monooxygenase family protein n=1 Tax=Arthrobacter sp. MYb227 TaxID=1848601 RepID=UPI000CFBB65F|nr:antibiotic biosynthesis monooxygenase [Arthrobacter sp. MYb227]PQZ96254.1 antibiotic biosynthesis monooxygenase [Arthrobacter sp. MYb227]